MCVFGAGGGLRCQPRLAVGKEKGYPPSLTLIIPVSRTHTYKEANTSHRTFATKETTASLPLPHIHPISRHAHRGGQVRPTAPSQPRGRHGSTAAAGEGPDPLTHSPQHHAQQPHPRTHTHACRQLCYSHSRVPLFTHTFCRSHTRAHTHREASTCHRTFATKGTTVRQRCGGW